MRYEIKVVLNEEQLAMAYSWMYKFTTASDKYPSRNVNSVYYDDVNFSSVRDNLTGIPNRKKIRLRYYNDRSSSDIYGLCLEEKIKNGRLGFKNIFNLEQIQRDFFNVKCYNSNLMIYQELLRTRQTNGLKIFNTWMSPTLKVSYMRSYYETNEGIRITFDRDVKYQLPDMNDCIMSGLTSNYSNTIMEIKFHPDNKEKVSRLMRNVSFVPRRHSKYLTGLSMLGMALYL